ncbi:MAG: hypothetical protein HY247_05445 [archaeon]|nr:MAG: hypothetical protein HY247_05445 [archaeon]
MASRKVVYALLPIIAIAVILMAYFRAFSSTAVIALVVVLYIVVSVMNRRKFAKQEREAKSGKAR